MIARKKSHLLHFKVAVAQESVAAGAAAEEDKGQALYIVCVGHP